MKLKNKQTGMIGEAGYYGSSDGKIIVNNIDDEDELYEYDSLAELIEAGWEDYEEDNYYWYIDDMGMPSMCSKHHDKTAKRKAFGNYFETEEEAEKAVEKLKAWKRLKDSGLVIKKWSHTPDMHLTTGSFLKIKGFIPAIMKNMKDLDLLFGGEE